MSLDLDHLTLTHGSHDERVNGVCIMEAVAWFAGEPHSDHPDCASPVLTAFLMSLNDQWEPAQRKPHAMSGYGPGSGDTASCGHPNPVWYADSQLWNEIMNGGDRDEQNTEIVCPSCFADRADAYFKGKRWRLLGWRMVPDWGRP